MINLDAIKKAVGERPEIESRTNIQIIADKPVDDDDIEIFNWCLSQYEKRNSFINGQRNQFLTALANFANEYGVSYETCLNECHKRFIQSDFTLKEIEATIKSIYRNHSSDFGKSQYISKSNESKPLTSAFPIEVFPAEIQFFINELKEKKALPHDYICGAILAAFSTALGKKVQVKHDNYLNYAGIWIAIVGHSGTNKTEPFKICFAPLKEHDNNLYTEYELKLKEFEEYTELPAKEKKDRKIEKPLLITHIVEDITFETLYDCLNANNHGICSHQEELMAWVMDMERYGNNSNQSKWLSIWSNVDTSYLRKSQKVRIPKPFVNVAGGIQPDLLKALADGNRTKDGTIYRILFCYPENANQAKPKGFLDEIILQDYKKSIQKLLSIEFDTWENSENNSKSQIIYIDKNEAAALFDQFNDKLRDKLNSLPECAERKFIAKLQIYLYRLTLLLHLIKYSVSDNEIIPGYIDKDTVNGAIKMIEYFHQTALKIGQEITNKKYNIPEKDLLIILRHKTGREYNEILNFMKSDISEASFRQWLSRSKNNKF